MGTITPSEGTVECPRGWPRPLVFALALAACGAALALRGGMFLKPSLVGDDFQILRDSWTWQETVQRFWTPHNEHCMPLGRLTTRLLVQCAGTAGNVPQACAFQGLTALAVGMILVYFLVRREVGHPFPALLAMALFGVNNHYQEAVWWYAASFGFVALDTILLGLLAAQRWHTTGHIRWLVATFACSALAPAWFGTGWIGGLICALYLLPSSPSLPGDGQRGGWRRWLGVLVPLAGTLLALAVIGPLSGEKIAHLERVGKNATAWEKFDSFAGLIYTLRALVDDLILRAADTPLAHAPPCSPTLVIAGLMLMVVLAAWWWLRTPNRRLLLAGLGLIFISYVLIYSGRSYDPYESVHGPGRYHLYAHLGLVLFVCGGWPLQRSILGSAVTTAPVSGNVAAGATRTWSARYWLEGWQHWPRNAVVGLVFLGWLVLTQASRYETSGSNPEQQADLKRIDAVDAFCRAHGIGSGAAREVLRAELPRAEPHGYWNDDIDLWEYLRGSDAPGRVTNAGQLTDAQKQQLIATGRAD